MERTFLNFEKRRNIKRRQLKLTLGLTYVSTAKPNTLSFFTWPYQT